jgi:hypothetical protein
MAGELRALSVRQPWAWAICHGKDVENRSRGGLWRLPEDVEKAVRAQLEEQ